MQAVFRFGEVMIICANDSLDGCEMYWNTKVNSAILNGKMNCVIILVGLLNDVPEFHIIWMNSFQNMKMNGYVYTRNFKKMKDLDFVSYFR